MGGQEGQSQAQLQQHAQRAARQDVPRLGVLQGARAQAVYMLSKARICGCRAALPGLWSCATSSLLQMSIHQSCNGSWRRAAPHLDEDGQHAGRHE